MVLNPGILVGMQIFLLAVISRLTLQYNYPPNQQITKTLSI